MLFSFGVLLCTLAAAANFADSRNSTDTRSESQQFTSSTIVATTESQNVGQYIAAGIGLSSASLATNGGNSTIPHLPTDTNSATAYGNTVITTLTTQYTTCTPYSYAYSDTTEVGSNCDYPTKLIPHTFTNTSWASAVNAEECWTEWVDYWSMHPPTSTDAPITTNTFAATTKATTYTFTSQTNIVNATTTLTIVSTAPTRADNNGFTATLSGGVTTYTTTITGGNVPLLSDLSTSVNLLTLSADTLTLFGGTSKYDTEWPTPSCDLPKTYSSCQSQWESYASQQLGPNAPNIPSNCSYDQLAQTQTQPACFSAWEMAANAYQKSVEAITTPLCPQASITGAICTSLKDAYVGGKNGRIGPHVAPYAFTSAGYYSLAYPAYTGWTWPANQEFAPGCTLGCGRCAVTGGEIQLLYFPPGLSPHAATQPIVATTLGTVLTSPTYYLSFKSLYASDACSGVGTTIGSTIIAIPTDQPLSSMFATTVPCYAHVENNPWNGLVGYGTAAFNVTDLLQDPVPFSIYTSQPFCVSQIADALCDPTACSTDGPYRPIVVVSSQLLNTLNPAWASCSLDLRGLYDPPKALTPATSVDGVTTPNAGQATISATPASGPGSPTPSATSTGEPLTQSQGPAATGASIATPPATSSAVPESEDSSPNPQTPSPTVENPTTDSGDSDSRTTVASSADIGGVIASIIKRSTSAESAESSQANSPDPASSATSNTDPSNGASSAVTADSNDPGGAIASTIEQSTATESSKDSSSGPASSTADFGSDSRQASTLNALTVLASATIPSNAGATGNAGAGTIADNDNGSDQTITSPSLPQATDASAPQSDQSSGGDLVIGGQTISPGQATAISGIAVAVGSSGSVVIGGSTIELGTTQVFVTVSGHTLTLDPTSSYIAKNNPESTGLRIVISVASQAITATLGQPLVISGSTLSSDQVATVGGHTISSNSAGLVIDETSTVSLPAGSSSDHPVGTASPTVISAGSQAITVTPGKPFVISGSTLSSGQAAIVGGHTVSSNPAGLVIDGTSTVQLPTSSNSQSADLVVTLNGQLATASTDPSDAMIINDTTLVPGASAATIQGTEVSAGLVVGGSMTVTLSSSVTAAATLTLGNDVLTACNTQGTGAAFVDGTTLSLGGPAATIDGTLVSMNSAGLVIGGTQTVPITRQATTASAFGPTSADGGDTPATNVEPMTATSSQSGVGRFGVSVALILGALSLSLTRAL
ncbi:hypothetical protein LTR97_008670 [Elasticomyces elasticus]|uniref:Hyphally-regulated cell wall protein N-terminal domain-containing protein n=1 Tax=Elasticomyces elasticus TaxID=574655 RepID=A0AAN8A1F7_9PEZI|nr:hypothetical protein LTR97_008670 [Elasticomyces elasticus]